MAFGNDRSFRPKPGRYGVVLATLVRDLGTDPVTQDATNTQRIGAPAGDPNSVVRSKLIAAGLSAATVADGGTITATLIKRRAADNADVALTAALDLEAAGLTASEQADFVVTASDDDLTFASGDVLEIDITSSDDTVSTNLGDGRVVAEFAVLH